jgi:outer membrane receptor protein involved in Fe transport
MFARINMKTAFIISFLLISMQAIAQNGSVKGKIFSDGKPLSFVTVSLTGSNKGVTTNDNGRYEIIAISPGSYLLTVSSIGYKTQKVMIVVIAGAVVIQDFTMQADQGQLNEVIVTGVSRATQIRQTPQTLLAVSSKQITTSSENNVIDAIAKNAPGLQTVKTGPNVSKPFINGLGYNRVLTLYDGLRVETQQWGDEHGVPIDDYIIEKAEVIEGPASLLYGSDAIAGVLSLFPAMPKDTDRQIHGRFLSEYQTNNGLIGNNLSLYYGSKHWDWALRGSERIARNYTNPVDGRVYNSSFRMFNASAYLSYHTSSGYTHLNATFYDNRQGIPDGTRDSLTRKFTYQVYESPGENTLLPQVDDTKNRPVVPNNVLNSYQVSPLSQRIQDYRLYNDNFYKLGQGDLKASLGYEYNERREYNHPTDANQAGTHMVLNTLNYSFRYNAPAFSNFSPTVGFNGIYQTNSNKDATNFTIPNYHLFDLGGYGYLTWKRHRWTVAGGLRVDHRNETGDDLYISNNPATGFFQQAPAGDQAAVHQFDAFHLSFQGISGSVGATYALNDQLSLKGNIARGYRTPNITEIASNGLDPGAHIYYVGNLDFKPEFSLEEDLGLLGTLNNFQLGITLFNNYIQNYIYEDQEVDKQGNPVVIIPGNKTFQYQQTNARLQGLNATINIHPEDWKVFRFDNSFSLVYGDNLNPKYNNQGVQGQYLPLIPSPRWLSSIAYTLNTGGQTIPAFTLKGENDLNLAQNRYLGLYNTETPTAAYDVVDLSANGDIHYSKSHSLQWVIAVNNIFDTAYQNHLSRLQYFEYYTASPNGHSGIYNMGRNIAFKIIVPF